MAYVLPRRDGHVCTQHAIIEGARGRVLCCLNASLVATATCFATTASRVRSIASACRTKQKQHARTHEHEPTERKYGMQCNAMCKQRTKSDGEYEAG